MTRGCIDSPKFRQLAREIARRFEGTEICDPHVVFTINRRVPRAVHTTAGEMPDLHAVRPNRIDHTVTLRSDPRVSVGIERQAPKLLSKKAQKLLLQYAVDERVLRNAPGEVTGGESTAVGDPRGSVGSNCDIERTTIIILLKTYRLVRIAAKEYINAVVLIARNPDIALGIR